ncbi:MAG: exopolyphosphatase [Bacteroidetes bacterium]|jgi:exopolyphosphatase/guanosine-5'-triphosphate,3'-diphosphate pyrophosphatase|nr:exopolyphosphatase [Bacteroidota bacterium]
MRIAIIDLGTNTFNILIVEIAAGKYQTLYQTKLAVKLGEGGINRDLIQPIPFQRGIDALKEYQRIINEHSVEKVYAFATSAVRDASNGKEFVKKIKEETGYEVQVIDGDQEAEYIYHGVCEAVKMSEEKFLIIDIGGGSIEFIIGNKDKIFWKKSFPVGAARLIERFKPSDPITDKQIIEIRDYLRSELLPLVDAIKEYHVTELIGSSGSFDSLAEMISHRFYTPEILDNVTEYTFDFKDFAVIFNDVIKSTRKERLRMKGLIEMRVDMIVVSMIIVQYVLWAFDIKKVRLSTYALKEGVLRKLLKKDSF